ncbi:MAG: hypothetical protein J0L93_04090 [Deltaproteobacteria bacterium]|nr:hypothetical protein [Deltaproteobacteria bacterium]
MFGGSFRFCASARSVSLFRVSIIFLTVSLAFEATNILAMGLEKNFKEASSPEDEFQTASENSSPGPSFLGSPYLNRKPSSSFSEIPSVIAPLGSSIPPSATNNISPALLTPGVFPYQPSPVSALIAAAITMGAMSLKETGKVDFEGILYMLNSSDFYVGLLGAWEKSPLSGPGMQQIFSGGIAQALEKAIKASPKFLKPILDNPTVKALGNITDGLSYTFMTGAGYEYYSQVWMYATEKIPEAYTMTGVISSSWPIKKKIASNLLYYMVLNPDKQKQILSSVYNHRIMTFEFLATNVMLYVGAQVGYLTAQKFAPGNPFAQNLAPLLGGIAGGLTVQMIPDSWKSNANMQLVDYKINRQRRFLTTAISRVNEGVNRGFYPAARSKWVGYLTPWMDLQSDVEDIFSRRRMLMSLQLEKMIYGGDAKAIFLEVQDGYAAIEKDISSLIQNLELTLPAESLDQRLDRWSNEGRTPEEVQNLNSHLVVHPDQKSYYRLLLGAALDRIKIQAEETNQRFAYFANGATKAPADVSKMIWDISVESTQD